MAWQSPGIARSDLERLLHEFETKLARLARGAARPSAEASRTIESMGDMVATAVADLAERIRGRARNVDVSQLSDDAMRFGNKALRKLTHEVEHRPLVTLAIAAGIGALVFGLLARRD
jgi:ElaB/YqjD/DUF883 family membrane-anchored ribosome-binding protein